jgi:uncharacterized protein YjbI with pentapeptide repeats
MSITIYRRDGTVAFVAEDAADVRAAVQQAVSRRADLREAYLRGAYLRGADLREADLSRADLSGAYLREADLREAYLRRADLREAYLRGAYLRGADLREADLSRADLRRADLSGADLRRADLSRADLSGAYLRRADLSGADLSRADLRGAYLSAADAKLRNLVQPLRMLLDQPGPIRAYKLVTANMIGPFNGGITYRIGETVSVDAANTDDLIDCAAGINVATLDWCMREWRPSYRILIVEFTAADIAAIPVSGDGKFRLHRCTVVGEKDLVEIGLVEAAEAQS